MKILLVDYRHLTDI